jgi:CrcB protein
MKLLLIALGGGAGALLRYLVSGWAQQLSNGPFPLGTLAVNLCGCVLIGFLGAVFAGPLIVREEYRIAVLVGLLGSFSTYGFETLALLEDGEWGPALLNVMLSNGFGLAAVFFGLRAAQRWQGA